MKKTVSLFLVLIFTIVTITSVSANDSIEENLITEYVATYSEFEIIENLKKQSDQELAAQGISKDEINEIRNFDPTEELLRRAQLGNKTLKNMGYSDEQIEIFKKYEYKNDFQDTGEQKTIPKEDMIILASKISVNMSQISFSHSSTNGTKATVNFSWSWSSLPIQRLTDIVAVSWGKELGSDRNSSYARVNYRNEVTGKITPKNFSIDTRVPNRGCSFKFPMNNYSYGGDAVSGYARVYLSEPDRNISTFEVLGAYGHNLIIPIPSVSFPPGGGITFKTDMIKYPDDHTVK